MAQEIQRKLKEQKEDIKADCELQKNSAAQGKEDRDRGVDLSDKRANIVGGDDSANAVDPFDESDEDNDNFKNEDPFE